MINKRDLTRSRTPTDTEMKYQLSQIPNKVDKEPNKGLSTNDFTNEYKLELDKVIEGQHHHNNLGVLNSISRDEVNSWNKAVSDLNNLMNYTELYSDAIGSNGDLVFTDSPLNYEYLFVQYGNDTLYDNKILIPTNKQFCITLNIGSATVSKAFYTMNTAGFVKATGGDTIYVYKVLGFKKGEM